MKLNKNSWHSKYYKWMWVCDVPSNLCDYFWGLALALISSIFIIGRYAAIIFDSGELDHKNIISLW